MKELVEGRVMQGWISVKESLPDKYTDVLVWPAHNNSVEVDSIMGDGEFLLHKGITHWMPMPAPPKMEGKIADV